MIYSLNGKLIMSKPGAAVIECGGVGYLCSISLKTLGDLPTVNSNAFLYTYMAVREDSVDLFGFSTVDELDAFKLLISVSGVGPKVALALLSDNTSNKLSLYIAAGDYKALTKTSGVGPKLAQRVVLELKDKVSSLSGSSDDVSSIHEISESHGNISDAISALCALGYTRTDAATALKNASESESVDALIKFGLKNLNTRRM